MRPDLEAADALEDVRRPAGLAELAVVDDVETDGDLLAHDVLDGRAQRRRIGRGAVAAGGFLRGRAQLGRPHEAADVSRENAIVAAFHG